MNTTKLCALPAAAIRGAGPTRYPICDTSQLRDVRPLTGHSSKRSINCHLLNTWYCVRQDTLMHSAHALMYLMLPSNTSARRYNGF